MYGIEWWRKLCEANREKAKAQQRAYRKAHPEKIKARRRAYHEAHPEKIKASARAYRQTNREEIKARGHSLVYKARRRGELPKDCKLSDPKVQQWLLDKKKEIALKRSIARCKKKAMEALRKLPKG